MLILGAGAVGLLACSLARASGFTSVVAVDIEQAKLDFAAQMGWASGTYTLPRGPRVSGFDAIEVAKSGWAGLQKSDAVQSVEGLEDGFDAVFECTGVESCMQLAVMVSVADTKRLVTTLCSPILMNRNALSDGRFRLMTCLSRPPKSSLTLSSHR